MVTWGTIECIERNGIITGYTVVFQLEHDGANVLGNGNIIGRTFSATELTPFTNYTFQVAGVNEVGTGPDTDMITITIDEEGELNSCYVQIDISPHMQHLVLCQTSLLAQKLIL